MNVAHKIAFMEAELLRDRPDPILLSAILQRLEELDQNIIAADQQILDAMNDESEQDEQDAEYFECEEYRMKTEMAKRTIHDFNSKLQATSISSSSSEYNVNDGVTRRMRNFELPKIELKKFDGELKNWLQFWSQYKKIHDDEMTLFTKATSSSTFCKQWKKTVKLKS